MTGISEDSTYVFTIDGIPFNNLPYREEAKRRSSTISGTDASNKYVGRYGGDSMQGGSGSSNSDYNERRPSSNSHSFNNNNNGGGRDSFSRTNNGGARQFNLQSPNELYLSTLIPSLNHQHHLVTTLVSRKIV